MPAPHTIQYPAYRQSVMGRNGVVTSGHPLASQAGIRILQAGGSLIDATGPAPGGATRDFYVDRGGIPMKGILSVSVPGIVDGWLLAHERFGKLPLTEVFAPAIELCEDGFPVSHKLASSLASEHERFSSDPYTAAIFEPKGQSLKGGELLIQRNLGNTFRQIAEHGRAALYEGDIARQIGEFSREYDGLITEEDLGSFHARWDDPIHTDYHGHRVYEMPPNSSGHILLQELNIVECFDLASFGCSTTESIHLMVEAKKLAFADREAYVADPDHLDIPIQGLLSKDYAKERASEIDFDRAKQDVPAGLPEAHEDTTCFTVADGHGNVACVLQSIQSGFGSSLIAGETGILLNNRMTYWHLDEGHPNCLAPGHRVRHTMNPVIATRDGKPAIVCGTPGADTQVQTNLQLLTHAIHFGMSSQEAVEAPRWRSQQNPMESTVPHTCENVLQVETRFDESVFEGLESRGHELRRVGDWGGPGNAQMIQRDGSGVLSGGVDPRRDGYVVAY